MKLIAQTTAIIMAVMLCHAQEPFKTTVFEGKTSGYEQFRIPALVITTKGTLLAFCAARKQAGDWSEIDIAMRRSQDGGKTWEPMRIIADRGIMTVDNPVPIVDRRTGSVHFLYQVNYAQLFYMRSDDEGVTWSTPTDITETVHAFRSGWVREKSETRYGWNVVAPGPGHGLQLANGRLLSTVWMSPSYTHRPSAIATIYSDDSGRTWKAGSLVPQTLHNPSEHMAVELADGRVMLNIRSEGQEHRRAVSISSDGISNWSKPELQPDLFEPVCMASILRLPATPPGKRDRLLFSNPDSRPSNTASNEYNMRSRDDLRIRMSEDGGKTWAVSKLLQQGRTGYSDMAAAPDGSVFILYEHVSGGKASLTFSHFTLDWLRGGHSTATGGKPIRVLPVGDSITRGSYLAHYTEGPYRDRPIGLPNPDGGGWRRVLQELLRKARISFEFVGELDYGAFGQDGQLDPSFDPDHHGLAGFGNHRILVGGQVPTPEDVLQRKGVDRVAVPGIVSVLQRHRPDVVLLMSGTNGFDVKAFEQLVEAITDNHSGCLLVATILPQRDPRKNWPLVGPYNQGVQEVLKQPRFRRPGIRLVAMHRHIGENHLLPDGVHPNAAGMSKMAEVWFAALREAMETPGCQTVTNG